MFDLTERVFEAEHTAELLEVKADLEFLCSQLARELAACFAGRDFESARLALAKLNVSSKKLQTAQTALERRQAADGS